MSYLAGVIKGERPWPSTGMTSSSWSEKPIWEFKFSELWATQDGVLFKHLLEDRLAPFGNDLYPHVVIWDGKFYLEDGHHRLVRAMWDGERTLACRWVEV